MSSIENIKLTKCKGELVDEVLATLELDTNGSLKVRVGRLAAYYAQHADDLEIANCDQCGGDSDSALEACPYCGDEGAVTAESEEDGEPQGSDHQEEDDHAEDDNTEVDDQPEVAAKEEEPMATSKKKSAAKPAAKTVKAPKPAKAAKGKTSKVSEPVVETTAITVVDSTELDEQVEVIREAVLGGAVALHRLGAAANKIVADNLWKQRVSDEGVPAFRSFKQFCVSELGLTAVHVYRAMKVSEEFTEDEIKQLSGKQVRLVLEVPKESRKEVIEAAKRGEAGGKLTQRANELRGGRKPLPEPKKAITVAIVAGHTKLKMYKRPTTGSAKVGETEEAVPAKKLADAPWAVMDLSNKVRMMLRITVSPKGELVADVEFRRGETL